jgi:anti-sigma factor RsiW
MNCTHIKKLLPLHVEGDLEREQEALVLLHLETCRECQEIAAQYEESQSWLRSYTPEFSPAFDDALFNELSAVVRRERAREEARPGFWQLIAPLWGWRPALAAAVALLAIVIGLAFYSRINRTPIKSTPNDEIVHRQPTPQSTPDKQNIKVEPDGDVIVEAAPPKQQPRQITPEPRESSAGNALALALPLAIARVLPPEAAAEYRNEVAASKDAATALERLLAKFSKPEVAAEPENPNTEASPNATPTPEVMRIEMQTANPNVRIIWLAPKETNSQPNKTDRDTN